MLGNFSTSASTASVELCSFVSIMLGAQLLLVVVGMAVAETCLSTHATKAGSAAYTDTPLSVVGSPRGS